MKYSNFNPASCHKQSSSSPASVPFALLLNQLHWKMHLILQKASLFICTLDPTYLPFSEFYSQFTPQFPFCNIMFSFLRELLLLDKYTFISSFLKKNNFESICFSTYYPFFSAHFTVKLFVRFDCQLSYLFHSPVSFHPNRAVDPNHRFIEISSNKVSNNYVPS